MSRTRRALWGLAIILALCGFMAAVGVSGRAHIVHAVGTSDAAAAHALIERADVHLDSLPGADDFELDVALTQTQNDCQTPLHGQICVRYAISFNDQPVQAGYGVIPAADVKVSGSTLTLRLDTRHDPHIVRTAGAGGQIALTWTAIAGLPHPASHTSILRDATVRGNVIGYTIPSTGVTAGIVTYGAP